MVYKKITLEFIKYLKIIKKILVLLHISHSGDIIFTCGTVPYIYLLTYFVVSSTNDIGGAQNHTLYKNVKNKKKI